MHLERQVHCTCPQSASVNLSTPAVWIRAEDLSCAAVLFSHSKLINLRVELQATPFQGGLGNQGTMEGLILEVLCVLNQIDLLVLGLFVAPGISLVC